MNYFNDKRMKTLKKKDRREYIKELIKDNYKCENLCGNNNLCVKILPYFKCGHFQCIDTTIKINFCITCGERKRIIKDNEVYNLENTDEGEIIKQLEDKNIFMFNLDKYEYEHLKKLSFDEQYLIKKYMLLSILEDEQEQNRKEEYEKTNTKNNMDVDNLINSFINSNEDTLIIN